MYFFETRDLSIANETKNTIFSAKNASVYFET